MVYYFDSSAAVKRYASEKGSRWVKDIVEPAAENIIYLGQIGVVEIATALSLNAALLDAGAPTIAVVTGDRILREAARDEGLSIENPDEH